MKSYIVCCVSAPILTMWCFNQCLQVLNSSARMDIYAFGQLFRYILRDRPFEVAIMAVIVIFLHLYHVILPDGTKCIFKLPVGCFADW